MESFSFDRVFNPKTKPPLPHGSRGSTKNYFGSPAAYSFPYAPFVSDRLPSSPVPDPARLICFQQPCFSDHAQNAHHTSFRIVSIDIAIRQALQKRLMLTYAASVSIEDAYIRSIFLCKTIEAVTDTKNQMFEEKVTYRYIGGWRSARRTPGVA